jgi:hypothetical protein
MYRAPAAVPTETLFEARVRQATRNDPAPLLFALAFIAALGAVLLSLAGAPRWCAVVVALAVPLLTVAAIGAYRKAWRTARIVRRGTDRHLVVDDVQLAFPLTLRGSQSTLRINGLPIHEAILQCIDARGATLHFKEMRGSAHRGRRDWLTSGIDEAHQGPLFDVPGVTAIGELRSAIEKHNDLDG